MPALISSTATRTSSFFSVGKCDSLISRSEKLTSRSGTATLVSASSVSVPSAGFAAPFAVYDTAMYATMCLWSFQLAICGWYSRIIAPAGELKTRGQPPSTSVGAGGARGAAGAGAALPAAGGVADLAGGAEACGAAIGNAGETSRLHTVTAATCLRTPFNRDGCILPLRT